MAPRINLWLKKGAAETRENVVVGGGDNMDPKKKTRKKHKKRENTKFVTVEKEKKNAFAFSSISPCGGGGVVGPPSIWF